MLIRLECSSQPQNPSLINSNGSDEGLLQSAKPTEAKLICEVVFNEDDLVSQIEELLPDKSLSNSIKTSKLSINEYSGSNGFALKISKKICKELSG